MRLLHSRFTAADRAANETEVIRLMGEGRSPQPYRFIVVGTQVMEQSLDLDFDVMITDVCPMDLLLQRTGRLHRHSENQRPQGLENPVCYVAGCDDPDPGSVAVYGEYHLFNTRILLPEIVDLPDDIPRLVQRAYGPCLKEGSVLGDAYAHAWDKLQLSISDKDVRARQFQICGPSERDLMRWLKDDLTGDDDVAARATVRDTEETLDVVLVRMGDDGVVRTLSGTDLVGEPSEDLVRELFGSMVPLPSSMTRGRWKLESIISELGAMQNHIPSALRESQWFRGDLFLVLDSNNKVQLKYDSMTYVIGLGLVVMKN